MRVLVVTGTGTGVGKTVTSAALAACALAADQRVAVVKPAQTGVRPGEPGDLAEVGRLSGATDLHEYVRYDEPLAPATAARRLGEPGPALAGIAARIGQLADRDLVIVEGAGGALVRFNEAGENIADLAVLLQGQPDAEPAVQVDVLLVVSAGLGTLHDAAAARLALAHQGLRPAALVIGDWPGEPDLATRCNLDDLPDYGGAPIGGVLATGAGQLTGAAFADLARRSLTPAWGGSLDAADFVAGNRAPRPNGKGNR